LRGSSRKEGMMERTKKKEKDVKNAKEVGCMGMCVGGWMDGWMDGWVDGYLNGWIDRQMDEGMVTCTYAGISL